MGEIEEDLKRHIGSSETEISELWSRLHDLEAKWQKLALEIEDLKNTRILEKAIARTR